MRRPELSEFQRRLIFWWAVIAPFMFIPEHRWLASLIGSENAPQMALGPVTIFFIKLAVTLAVTFAISLLTPKSNPESVEPDPAKASDFDFPTTEEDRPIGALMGIGLIQPNCIALGNLKEEEIIEEVEVGGGKESSTEEILVGYAYFLDMVWAIGEKVDRIIQFRMNGKRTWPKTGSASVTHDQTFKAKTGDTLSVRGSGTGSSTIRFRDGSQTTVSPTARSLSGGKDILYKGTSMLVMDGAFIGDEVRNVPQYNVVAVRTNLFPGESYQDIGDDANAAWMLRHVLETDLKVDPGQVNLTAFRAVAQTLYNEDFGLSLKREGQSAESYIQDILRHIDGFLFEDRATGLLTLKLARDDYDVGSIPELGEGEYRDLTLKRRGWDETYSEITIKYLSRRTWELTPFKEFSVANEDMIGYRRRTTVSFPLITRPSVAGMAAARLLPKMFTTLAIGSFKVPAAVLDPNPGDVVKLRHPNMAGTGFQNLVVRILAVDRDSKSDMIDVDYTEDVFSIGTIDVVVRAPSQFVPIDRDILNPVRFPIMKDALPNQAPAGKSVAVMAVRPDELTSSGFELAVNDKPKGFKNYAGTGVLEVKYPASFKIDNSTAGFIVKDTVDVAAVANTRGAAQRLATMALIDSGDNWEMISVQTITDLGGGRFRCTGNFRGIGGTPVIEHAKDTRVYFPLGNGFSVASRIINVSSAALAVPLSAKFTPVNSDERGPETTIAHSYGYRAETPYPVQTLSASRDGNDVTLSWIARLRTGGVQNKSVADYPDMLNTNWSHEGVFRVSADDDFGPVIVDGVTFVREGIATPQIYTVENLLNGRLSDPVTVEI